MDDTAFGAPGIAPTWSSSDKDFVTTALGSSRLWATIGHGIINEVYWPSTGEPQVRDLSFYLLGEEGGWIDLKRVRRYRLQTPGPGLPLLTITHYGDDYEVALEILPDVSRDVLLIQYKIQGPYQLAIILAPHLGSSGRDNDAWIDQDSGYAQRGEYALCIRADKPVTSASAGFVGFSDGWQDLAANGKLTYEFESALNGTIALTAGLAGAQGSFALGFADTPRGAETLVRSALAEGADAVRVFFLAAWQQWSEQLILPHPTPALGDVAVLSAVVLKMHEDRAYPGALVASLSVPWGNTSDSLGGYHLVWPRDATLTAFAFLAAKQNTDACRILAHLIAVQRADGRWPQNYFPNGTPFWTGEQLDEVAFPVLLAGKLHELNEAELPGTRAMVRNAVGFIARNGPTSDQDRWEENPGVSPFTVAVAITALVAAQPWLRDEERQYALDLADEWNERLEGWCYVTGTPLAQESNVAGYYVRIATLDKDGSLTGQVLLRNHNGQTILASALVSMDFSYLVRLGLRSPTDPRILDTLKIVDRVLKVSTPSGDLYHRYNEDGYGEYPDGRPYDGNGVGRAWPLLSGERGHLALQAGEDPLPYLHAIHACASAGGLLPEQVWDTEAIPDLGLYPGRPSGGAMPLLWAHAEFLKLLIARESKRPVELLDCVAQRYGNAQPHSPTQPPPHRNTQPPLPRAWRWREQAPVTALETGRALWIEDTQPFTLHFGWDGWQAVQERESSALPFGLWGVHLGADKLHRASELNFTRRYLHGWEGADHRITLAHATVDLDMKHRA